MGLDEEFPPKDGSGSPPTGGRNGECDFKKEARSNETHESTTDPDARLHRKGNGQESKLCYMGHVLMENRNGLAVLGEVTRASGTAERDAALDLIDRRRTERRITLGADKAYDVADFVQELRAREPPGASRTKELSYKTLGLDWGAKVDSCKVVSTWPKISANTKAVSLGEGRLLMRFCRRASHRLQLREARHARESPRTEGNAASCRRTRPD